MQYLKRSVCFLGYTFYKTSIYKVKDFMNTDWQLNCAIDPIVDKLYETTGNKIQAQWYVEYVLRKLLVSMFVDR